MSNKDKEEAPQAKEVTVSFFVNALKAVDAIEGTGSSKLQDM